MINKRKAERANVNLGVTKYVGGEAHVCQACEISSSGIKLEQSLEDSSLHQIIEIELPLVEGKLHTQVSARRVWQNAGFEAYEFIGHSHAQKTILERIYNNDIYFSDTNREGRNVNPIVQIIRKADAGDAVS